MQTTAKSSSEKFKSKDADSYEPLTAEFDRFTKRLTESLAHQLVTLAGLQPGQRVLDIGTGTAVLALPASDLVGSAGKVLGIDLSQGMLARARENAASRAAQNLDFRRLDAESLDLAEESFDAVISLFALLHFPNPDIALREMFRVLRPGGRLAIGIGSGPSRFSLHGLCEAFRHLQWLQLRARRKLLIAPTALDSFLLRRLPSSSEPEQSWLADLGRGRAATALGLVSRAGFDVVKTCWHGHANVIDTPEEFWDLQRTFSSIARKRLGRLSAHEVQDLREEFLHLCQDVMNRGGRLIYPFGAFFILAHKPGGRLRGH